MKLSSRTASKRKLGKRRYTKLRLKIKRRRALDKRRKLRAKNVKPKRAPAIVSAASAAPPEPTPQERTEAPGYRKGINIVGFIRAETGIGESSRLAAKSLEAVHIPFDILNFPVTNIRMEDLRWAGKEVNNPDFKVNVFHINADTMRSVHHYFGRGLFKNRYNIGYWHWELPDFPSEFCDSFEFVQEIWAPSSFVEDCISKKSPVPVHRIPHGIDVHLPPNINRGTFGLPTDRFLFFSMYDTQSYQRRKNPQGAIEAFKLAFERNDPSVGLVVKLNHSHAHPDDIKVLYKLIEGYNNIYLIDSIMTRGEVNGLLNCTDSFVSLHRSEGFGLGLAEAMFLGKPAIGTYWSGNTDFMNVTNCCPIGYSLSLVGEDWGPYRSYQTWAEPNIEHAAHSMRELLYNESFRHSVSINGQTTIRTEFSPQITGQMIKNRLTELGLL